MVLENELTLTKSKHWLHDMNVLITESVVQNSNSHFVRGSVGVDRFI